MKVRKEQFLLPKGKTINTSRPTSKWIQPTGEFSKNGGCTCFPSKTTSVEGLPSALFTKIKPDVFLSTGDIIVSGQPAGHLFWQQQDGILRQALLCTEKDVKSEENATDVEGSQTPANTSSLLTVTPVPATQVLKMNDYKVILSSEPLPVSWQENGKKNNTLSFTTLPTIKPKVDANPSLVIGEQPVTFASIANMNVLAQNQFPTIMIKDVKSTLPTNLLPSNSLLPQNSAPKKSSIKSIPKLAKVRKKPIIAKKIMLKPASSLLSQTALDRTNKDRIIESQKEKSSEENKLYDSLGNKVPTDDVATDYILKNSPRGSGSSNELPSSALNITVTTPNNVFSFNSGLGSKSSESNLSLGNFATKTGFPESLTSVKITEPKIIYGPPDVSVIGHTGEDGGIIITSDNCISGQGQTLGSSVISETVVIDSDSTVICSNGQTLLDTGVVVETNCNSEPSGSEDFHTDHVETILPSDIEHHEEHHTQEYTDSFLSQLQLSDSRVLPNMSSSQVSSVLNALAPSDKSDLSEISLFTSAKSDKEPVKCELTEFVKIESLQMPNVIKVKSKAPEPKYRVCELNKHTCFRCDSCSFLSLRLESVERHWTTEHRNSRSELLDRQLTRRQIKCLGCANVVYSKYALQIHLLCDHNVITTEVHDLIATTLAANKALRDLKRTSTLKSSSAKTKEVVQRAELNKEVELPPSTCYKSNVPPVLPTTLASTVSEPTEVDNHQLSQEPRIPPTPSFSLFSDIQLPNDKEEALPTKKPSEDEDSKTLINTKPSSKRLRKAARSKLRAEFGCEIKYNFRCMVQRCGVRFTTAANLSYHLRCHRPESDMFHCPECDTAVISWSSLMSHLWRHHGIDIDLYCCKLCGYKCNSYSKLINNHIKIHGDERPFLCDICGKGFKTTKQLRNHKAVHRARKRLLGEGGSEGERGESGYTCTICSRSFADARILRLHTQNVHNKSRPYLCTFCAHTASSKSSLRMHIRQHTGEKPFSCNECEYMTSDHNSLRRHKMRHSGLRPYQCPHCNYNCIQATTYKAHLKNKHPGMDEGLMFSCPMCPFRTVKKDNYLAHKAEHDLGGDPRKCRKKHPPPKDIIQEHTLGLCKTISHVLPDHETVVLLEDSGDLPSVEGAIELIVPD